MVQGFPETCCGVVAALVRPHELVVGCRRAAGQAEQMVTSNHFNPGVCLFARLPHRQAGAGGLEVPEVRESLPFERVLEIRSGDFTVHELRPAEMGRGGEGSGTILESNGTRPNQFWGRR